MPTCKIRTVEKAAIGRLTDAGLDAEQARVLVDHMLTADLWGRSSHGLSVRFKAIHRQAQNGAGENTAEIAEDNGARVVLDAHGGFGYVAGRHAARILIERVQKHGLASVALRDTLHTGMIGYYADMAAREGVVSMMFGDCTPLMAPCGGTEALLGTNPISFGFPTDEDPILVDMATSSVAYGSVEEMERSGEKLPERAAVDENGELTREPSEAKAGALLPFGGHRGGALAVAVQLLAGVATGADAVPRDGAGYGLLMVGLEKGTFAGEDRYEAGIRDFQEQYLSVSSRPGCEVRLPGSRRYEVLREHRECGQVEISEELARMLELG